MGAWRSLIGSSGLSMTSEDGIQRVSRRTNWRLKRLTSSRRNGRRLVDDLRQTVTRDAEAFRAEFAGDRSRDIVTEAHPTADSWSASRIL